MEYRSLLIISCELFALLKLICGQGLIKDPGLLSTRQKVKPEFALLGCYKIILAPNVHKYSVSRANVSLTPQFCINYCTYVADGGGRFDFAGFQLSDYTSVCYCTNNVHGSHSLVEDDQCLSECAVFSNRDKVCMNDGVALLYSTCTAGYFMPPLCTSQCASYCVNLVRSRARPCGREHQCAFGCVNGKCGNTYFCHNISGLMPVSPTPKPYDLLRIPAEFYLLHDLTFHISGQIRLVNFRAKSAGTAYVGIWRRNPGNITRPPHWIMTGKMQVSTETYGSIHYTLAEDEWLSVEPGDVVGIHQSAEVMEQLEPHQRPLRTLFTYFTNPGITQSPYKFENGSGYVSYVPDYYDDGWMRGTEILESRLIQNAALSMYVALQLGHDCPCSSNCNKGECDKSSGQCVFGCVSGWMGERCSQPCYDGYYGNMCMLRCSIRCYERLCEAETGFCSWGCALEGYKGYYCDVPCDAGEYGWDCGYRCSEHCNGTVDSCDIRTGFCGGCMPGYQEPDCHDPCETGFWGGNCSDPCGYCYGGNSNCFPETGECIAGCVAGYTPPDCWEVCPLGTWGPSCESACGACDGEKECDPMSGECSGACLPGYRGNRCDIPCSNNTYGLDCSERCSNCLTHCDPVSGDCLGLVRCMIGYQPPRCQGPCEQGTYGTDCRYSCGRCVEAGGCEVVEGRCKEGCVEGYNPPFCRCPHLRYGKNCTGVCGGCKDDAPCDDALGYCLDGCNNPSLTPPMCRPVLEELSGDCPSGLWGPGCTETCGVCKDEEACGPDGRCENGCQAGFEAPFCVTTCPAGKHGDRCLKECGTCRNKASCNAVTGACDLCQDGLIPPDCLKPCTPGSYGYQCKQQCGRCQGAAECDLITGVCPGDCEEGYLGLLCKLSLDPSPIGSYMIMQRASSSATELMSSTCLMQAWAVGNILANVFPVL